MPVRASKNGIADCGMRIAEPAAANPQSIIPNPKLGLRVTVIRVGVLCVAALAVSGLAGAAEGFPKGEGPRVIPPGPADGVAPTAPAVVPAGRTAPEGLKAREAAQGKERERLARLVDEYAAPLAAVEPGAEQKAAVEKLLKELGSADFDAREAASAGLIKLGAPALGLLREAAKSKDPEVADRAKKALLAIEARQPVLDQLLAADRIEVLAVVQERMKATYPAQQELAKALKQIEAGESKDDPAKLLEQATALKARVDALFRLKNRLSAIPQGGYR